MSEQPRLTCMGQMFILSLILACIGGGIWFTLNKGQTSAGTAGNGPNLNPGGTGTGPTNVNGNTTGTTPVNPAPQNNGGGTYTGNPVEIGIAYGTEKKRWMEWAVQQFAQTPDGQRYKIILIPMGSLEGGQAVVNGDKRINVWSPASSLYKDIFVSDWQVKYNNPPIMKEELLALSPMVFVFWDARWLAFQAKYKTASFTTLSQALNEKGGWDAIAQKPEWGLFKFGHTHPNQSNSGLMTLVLMGHEFFKKNTELTMKDMLTPAFQDWMIGFEKSVTGLSNSSGNMMKEMVLKGPSAYDCLYNYENVVIDFLSNAQGRVGDLHIEYPEWNMWNDNPYYILNAPWSSAEQKKGASVFLEFLMSEPVQKMATEHGFRPGNPAVPIKVENCKFMQYQKYGIKLDIPSVCPAPKADVINNLLASWQRGVGR